MQGKPGLKPGICRQNTRWGWQASGWTTHPACDSMVTAVAHMSPMATDERTIGTSGVYVSGCVQPGNPDIPAIRVRTRCITLAQYGTCACGRACAHVPSTFTCECSNEQALRSDEQANSDILDRWAHTPSSLAHGHTGTTVDLAEDLSGQTGQGAFASALRSRGNRPPQALAKGRVDHDLNTSVQVRALSVSDLS